MVGYETMAFLGIGLIYVTSEVYLARKRKEIAREIVQGLDDGISQLEPVVKELHEAVGEFRSVSSKLEKRLKN